MAERGDMTVLHEPLCNLRDYGKTDAGARTFDSPLSLLAWLRDETHDISVNPLTSSLRAHDPALVIMHPAHLCTAQPRGHADSIRNQH